MPHIFGKFQQELQKKFKHHFNRNFSQKVMGVQSDKNPNEGIMRFPTWESQEKRHLGVAPMVNHK
jgi:hypothetical protein